MEDTVMNQDEVAKEIMKYILVPNPTVCQRDVDIGGIVAQAQAEISFEAGQKSLLTEKQLTEHDDMVYLAGIKEVVDWVNNNIAFANIGLSYKDWQAQLKSWGIERFKNE